MSLKPGKTYAAAADPLGPLPTKGKTYAASAAQPPASDSDALPNDPPANRDLLASTLPAAATPPPQRRRTRGEEEVHEVNMMDGESEGEGESAERRRRRAEREEKEERERAEYEKAVEEREERRRVRKERKEREKREAEKTKKEAPLPPVERSRKHQGARERVEKTTEDAVSNGVAHSDSEGATSSSSSPPPSPKAPTKTEDAKPITQSLVSFTHKVRWAPLDVPLPRRLQMAAVLWHTLSISLFFGLFWFCLAVPLSWPLLVPYLIYIFFFATSHEDGSVPYTRSNLFRSLPLWRAYAGYFPLRLHRTVPLDASKNYIFAYHPHGIISHGAFGSFVTEATGFGTLFPGIANTLLTLDSNFRIPFYREYLLALGMASVSRRSCEALLRGSGRPSPRRLWNPTTWLARRSPAPPGGRAITIVVGGARESLEATPGTLNLVVKRRRGFLKIAMRERAGVVPVLSFGENELYRQHHPREDGWVHAAQLWAKNVLGFTLPLVHARGVFNYDVGLLPYRAEVNTVVGRPLFWQGEEVGEKEVEAFQRRYIEELERMWEEWKDVFAKDRLPGEAGEMHFVE
ncbi:diacylglycerol acyltransferase-domain-containing protein [Geopyxis carbonaria]|nr:diacylglycerol acyltransferase-domain-containing protein [Geopyxis carbonaria]